MPRPIHLLIKPASGNCNLRCAYCFYADITEKRETPSFGMMSEETLEAVVRKALERAQGEVTFAFQGGEPTLSGLPFFRRFVELVRAHNTRNLTVHSAIQTTAQLQAEAQKQASDAQNTRIRELTEQLAQRQAALKRR